MKTLIVEDDFTSRLLLQELLKSYGPSHIAVNGREAVKASRAVKAGEPYRLICLDIMMPEMDGQQALKEVRRLELAEGIDVADGVKIIMITALFDGKNVMGAFRGACDGYLVKPIDKQKLFDEIERLGAAD